MAAPHSNTTEAVEARRWKKELSLAGKREKDWRDESEKIIKRYRGEEKKKNRFNVLWANTEILRPAVYNSKPNPDVRRRFRDADPVGKAVGEVLERSLFVLVDGDSTDGAIRNDVLDALLPGRGLSRIRYVPKLAPSGETAPKPAPESGKTPEEGVGGSVPNAENEGTYEQVEYEQVLIEHVDWRDFRHSYGRVWEEVPAVFFRHQLTRKDAEKKFSKEQLGTIKFAAPTTDDAKKPGEQTGETQKVAEFWECWDKLGERVFFLHEEADALLFPTDNPDGEPPLEFEGFFPIPEPLKFVENTGSLLPIPPFHLYEEQANELDKISVRIDKIVNTCRLRGIYDGKLVELADLMTDSDNELTPVQNAQAWTDAGLDKAITWFPVDKAQAVLAALYDARTRQKEIIDELTGISDIIRGNTDPDETYGAQQLKSNYASLRLQRMQKEAQRYARDLLRLASQVMACRFGQDTFAQMTDLRFPTMQEKAQLAIQMQQPPQPGQPPPNPALLKVPTWDDILQLMHSSALRQYRVDVETDSTVAGMVNSDMAGLSQVLKAISETMQGLAPMVTSQALPVDAAKEVVLAVIRRARLGMAVEDAFDKLQAPQPPPDPNAGKAQAAAAAAQAKGEVDIKVANIKADLDAKVAEVEQRAQAAQNAQEQMLEEQREERKAWREDMETRLNAAVKIIVAEITAKQAVDVATIGAANREATTDLSQ